MYEILQKQSAFKVKHTTNLKNPLYMRGMPLQQDKHLSDMII
jgi:hypothetical protein